MNPRPLEGLRVIELAAIGPTPFCGMMLADLGASVLRIDRPGPAAPWASSPMLDRGRERMYLNLKDSAGVQRVLAEIRHADVLLEGLRPGVTERLGVGPGECHAQNPRLVYARMTGWGQDGPYAQTAGHDITYLATSGVLHAIGERGGPPVPPGNLLGDFGGGGMLLAVGVLAAVLAARSTGRGTVVDASILDGAGLLAGFLHGLVADGTWTDERGVNLLDGGAPFYATYRCADGRYVAVGALEHRFFAALVERLDLGADPAFDGDHLDRRRWPAMRERLSAVFAGRSRDAWAEHFRGTDCCVAPVLSLTEAAQDAHAVARGIYREVDGVRLPRSAPRFSDPRS